MSASFASCPINFTKNYGTVRNAVRTPRYAHNRCGPISCGKMLHVENSFLWQVFRGNCLASLHKNPPYFEYKACNFNITSSKVNFIIMWSPFALDGNGKGQLANSVFVAFLIFRAILYRVYSGEMRASEQHTANEKCLPPSFLFRFLSRAGELESTFYKGKDV